MFAETCISVKQHWTIEGLSAADSPTTVSSAPLLFMKMAGITFLPESNTEESTTDELQKYFSLSLSWLLLVQFVLYLKLNIARVVGQIREGTCSGRKLSMLPRCLTLGAVTIQ